MDPFVSIIIPCYNEENFIPGLLEDLLHQDYPRDRMEILIVDGLSTDRTREIIAEYAAANPFIRLLDNEKRFVPFALNIAVRGSKGEVIIRMDAHAKYPPDYVSRLVRNLFELNADNTGGVWITVPGNKSLKALAISKVLSSPFGVGNALYRLNITKAQQTDTVPFGCYRRDVFDRIGFFDEDLLRNQDDEFNARLIRSGGSVWLIPDVKITYFARSSVGSLLRMFYQYGFYKPLVNRKTGRPATARQFAPPLFVLFLLVFPLAGLIFKPLLLSWYAGLCLYVLADLIFTFGVMLKSVKPALFFYLPWIFFLVHISYGWGYLSGIPAFLLKGNKNYQPASTR